MRSTLAPALVLVVLAALPAVPASETWLAQGTFTYDQPGIHPRTDPVAPAARCSVPGVLAVWEHAGDAGFATRGAGAAPLACATGFAQNEHTLRVGARDPVSGCEVETSTRYERLADGFRFIDSYACEGSQSVRVTEIHRQGSRVTYEHVLQQDGEPARAWRGELVLVVG